MKATWLFRGAVALSIAAHAALLAARAGQSTASAEQLVEIPVVLEAEVEPPPPQPPPPEPPKPKPRPRDLASHIDQVVESDGARAGELVDVEVGEYAETEEVEPEPIPEAPEPAPPPPEPEPEPQPKVDRVALARAYLQQVRGAIAGAKRYPFRAQRMGIGGAVSVSFVIQPDSRFGSVAVKRSSGYDVLDEAAVRTVRSLSGRMPRPTELGETPLRASITLRYQLDGNRRSACPRSRRCPHRHERGRHGRRHGRHGRLRGAGRW